MSEDPSMAIRRLYGVTVATLPPMTRTVFLLHRAEGVSLKDIAERLDLSETAVVTHIAHALIALDRALRDAGA